MSSSADPAEVFYKHFNVIPGLWNYQILLLVHGQVSGQNLHVQPKFTCPKVDIFLASLRKRMLWVLIRS